MRPSTLARLERLAQERERALLDAVRRQQAMLRQSEQQTDTLAAYRDRLAASWQSGVALPAGQARRAGAFAAASLTAQAQVSEAARQAELALASALENLGTAQARRHVLTQAIAAAGRAELRAREDAAERDVTWRRDEHHQPIE